MECPVLLETTLGEMSEELLLQLGTRRFPLGGSFELTERCNLGCVHCYINQAASSPEARVRELALPQVRNILDQLAQEGCLYLLFTGGEPLLRRDFADIWRHAKGKGILVSLFTNGTLLTPSLADMLAEYRPWAVEVTLYGATQETYEQVTRAPGSHARCMRGIEMLLERGLRLNLKSVLLRANRHELEAMKALAEGLGVSYRFDGVLYPRLEGDQAPLRQSLSPAELVALDQEYPARQEEYDGLYRNLGAAKVRSEYIFSCGAGHRSFHIDSAGQLSVCMMARRPSYDLMQGSFREGWSEFMPRVLQRKRTLDTPCIECPVGVLCLQCPGWSQLAHGDDETIVDYVCRLGHLRAAQTAVSAGASPGGKDGLELSGGRKITILTGPKIEKEEG